MSAPGHEGAGRAREHQGMDIGPQQILISTNSTDPNTGSVLLDIPSCFITVTTYAIFMVIPRYGRIMDGLDGSSPMRQDSVRSGRLLDDSGRSGGIGQSVQTNLHPPVPSAPKLSAMKRGGLPVQAATQEARDHRLLRRGRHCARERRRSRATSHWPRLRFETRATGRAHA